MDISKLLADPLPDRRHSERHQERSSGATYHSTSPHAHSSRSSQSRSKSSSGNDKAKRRICEICGHSFVSKAHLAIHDRTVHQRLKLYQCDICKSSFGQVGTLTRHKAAVHEKRRDHECTYPGCKKRFGSRWTLSVHERNVHEKIKPYVCNFPDCERQFGNAWNQKKHEAQAHSFNHGGASTQLTANVAPVLRRDQGSSSEASGPPMPRLQGVYGSQRPHHHPLVRRLPVPTEQYIHGKAFANSTSTSKFHVDATRRRK